MAYSFQNQELLMRALTHSSHVHEAHRVPVDPGDLAQLSNEQFEFLGDAILGFVISEELVRRFPQYGEGEIITVEGAPGQRQSLARGGSSAGIGAISAARPR